LQSPQIISGLLSGFALRATVSVGHAILQQLAMLRQILIEYVAGGAIHLPVSIQINRTEAMTWAAAFLFAIDLYDNLFD
jgi:hypothetical protein